MVLSYSNSGQNFSLIPTTLLYNQKPMMNDAHILTIKLHVHATVTVIYLIASTVFNA